MLLIISISLAFSNSCVSKGVWIRPFGKLIYSIVAYTIKEEDLRKIVKTMIEAIKSIKS